MKVTRPSANGRRFVGTTKLAGSFCNRKPRRCCAGGQTSQAWVDVLGVDRLLQPHQLPPQSPRPTEVALEQGLLEPAVEVLDAAVELRLPFRDKHRADAKAQTQPDHPTQGACRRSPARQFAGVVELHLFGPPQ